MAATPIIGNSEYIVVGNTVTLSNAVSGGTWSSSDTSVATINASTGVVTAVASGNAIITYTNPDADLSQTVVSVIGSEYTNCFSLSTLLPVMMSRKGWRQPTSSDFTINLDDVSKKCLSGMYYNNDHNACSPANLIDNQEDSGISENDFNVFLRDLKQQVAIEALVSVFRQPYIIEPPKMMYNKAYRTDYIDIPNTSRFCGWQIKLSDGDVATKIESIALMFNKACNVTIYAYNDMRQAALWSRQFTVTDGYDQQVFNVDDLILTPRNDKHKGGVFYIGYYQDEIDAQDGAQGVNMYLNSISEYFMIGYMGFDASSDFDNKTFVRNLYYGNYKTYGLNLELSTCHDHTNTVIRNAYAFDKLQGLIMTQKCIEIAMNSLRNNSENRDARGVYETLYNEIEGLKGGEGIPYRQGLRDKIIREVETVSKMFFDNSKIETTIPPYAGIDGLPISTWGNRMHN